MPGKKQLEWSRRAETNLDAIFDYIAADNLAAAESVIVLLLKTAERLTDFPMMGHRGRRAGTREFVLAKFPYTLVYRLTSSKVCIVAVLHHARQYP